MVFWRKKGAQFLEPENEKRLLEAIRRAEEKTSGEIRVHVDARFKGDPLDAARRQFVRLGMSATVERNGVLFYVVPRQRKFAILGDEGIHRHVGEAFWNRLRDLISESFTAGKFEAGLEEAIAAVGEELAVAFPRKDRDVNELPDSISYSEPGPDEGDASR